MVKCEKCGQEYEQGEEHVCTLQKEQERETAASSEEKTEKTTTP